MPSFFIPGLFIYHFIRFELNHKQPFVGTPVRLTAVWQDFMTQSFVITGGGIPIVAADGLLPIKCAYRSDSRETFNRPSGNAGNDFYALKVCMSVQSGRENLATTVQVAGLISSVPHVAFPGSMSTFD